jgi:hypothetical protein
MGRPARPLVVLAAAVAVVCAAAPTAAAAVPAAALAGAPTAAADPSPSFPGPPVVVDILPTRATLTWQPPNTEPPVTYYRTYRVSMRDGQPWEEFYNASYATSLLLALPTPDTGYTFFVETGDQTSNGLRSPWVTFRTPPAPIESQPPTAPGLPEASAVDPNALTLTWAPSTDNSGVAAYHIYRTRHDGAVQPAGVTVTQTTWSFTRLLPDFDYRYHVVAVDHGGNRSASSPAVTVRTPPDPRSSCQVGYTATDHGNGTFTGTLTLRNTGSLVEVYPVRLILPAGQRISISWSLAWAQVGDAVVFWYDGWAGGPADRRRARSASPARTPGRTHRRRTFGSTGSPARSAFHQRSSPQWTWHRAPSAAWLGRDGIECRLADAAWRRLPAGVRRNGSHPPRQRPDATLGRRTAGARTAAHCASRQEPGETGRRFTARRAGPDELQGGRQGVSRSAQRQDPRPHPCRRVPERGESEQAQRGRCNRDHEPTVQHRTPASARPGIGGRNHGVMVSIRVSPTARLKGPSRSRLLAPCCTADRQSHLVRHRRKSCVLSGKPPRLNDPDGAAASQRGGSAIGQCCAASGRTARTRRDRCPAA